MLNRSARCISSNQQTLPEPPVSRQSNYQRHPWNLAGFFAGSPTRLLAMLNAMAFVVANGIRVETELPCSLEVFLTRQNLRPKSVVVEQNGEAVAPSEFPSREVHTGDRLEIVQIVAGG